MIKIKYILLYTIMLITYQNSLCQDRDAVLKKLIKQYNGAKPLEFSTTYNLYKNVNDKKINESYTGKYVRNSEGLLYMKINDTEFYAKKEFSLQVSVSQKIILLTKPNQSKQSDFDVSKLLVDFKKGAFEDKKTHWEIELLATPFSGLPYSRIILYVGKDYLLQKQKFFYSTALNFSKNSSRPDYQYPVLEVIFSKYNRLEPAKTIFDTTKYLSVKKNKIELQQKFSNYELIDKR